MGKTRLLEIICGTSEGFLLGYTYNTKEKSLKQSFAVHHHNASIRCISLSDHYLATGSSDDRIIIYDLRARKELQTLIHHNGTVNCVEFTHNHSHLISGSWDGVLSMVRVGNWQLEKEWSKAHKGQPIKSISVHESDKLALTLGADCTLSTWNLVKGRQAYVINLNSKCKDVKSIEKVIWAPDGVHFVLFGGKYTEIWSIEKGGPEKQIEHEKNVSSCLWIDAGVLMAGYENGQICIFELESNERDIRDAHKSRVKGLEQFDGFIISVCSDGEIKVWTRELEEICSHNTEYRINCLKVSLKADIKTEKIEEEEVVNEKNDGVGVHVGVGGSGSFVVVEEEEEDDEVKAKKRKKRRKLTNK